jgi:Zn-dependent peptidase ImmA (M78 family)/DNA-binding XRE family transcriptional regulator
MMNDFSGSDRYLVNGIKAGGSSIGSRLKERRERVALTQDFVAKSLGTSREVLSMWETNVRQPNERQLEELAALYRTSVAFLRGDIGQEKEDFFFDLSPDPETRRVFDAWVRFLDRWAVSARQLGLPSRGPGKPPKALDERELVRDARRAPTLAVKVREYLNLGLDAVPDMYALLDENNILVYRASLGKLSKNGNSISGAFYNHPEVGFSILVNADTFPGRQTLTLAHEFAHALYHYSLGSVVSCVSESTAEETFANTFALHFLVPGRTLREQLKRMSSDLDHLKVFRLAYYFNIGYRSMLVRLFADKLISEGQLYDWASYDVRRMAENWGLRSSEFTVYLEPTSINSNLGRYPLSVIHHIKRALEQENINVDQAAWLLDVAAEEIRSHLVHIPHADLQAKAELEQLLL